MADGKCRGKPSATDRWYGPVTTEPFLGEASVLRSPGINVPDLANLRLGQYAGSLGCISEMKA